MSYHVRRPESLKASLRTRSVGSPPAAARRRPSLPRSGNTSTCPHGARPWRLPPASPPCATSTGQGAYAGARVAYSHGRSALRSNRRPITSWYSIPSPTRPLSGSAQPGSHMTLVSCRHCHRASQGSRRPPGWPARKSRSCTRAGDAARGFLLDRRPPERRGRRLLFRASTAGYTATAAGAERGHPPPRLDGRVNGRAFRIHSVRGRARAVGRSLPLPALAAAVAAPGGQPSAQFNAWPPPCPSPQRFGSTDRRPPDSLRAAAGRRGSAFGGWRGQARQRLING